MAFFGEIELHVILVGLHSKHFYVGVNKCCLQVQGKKTLLIFEAKLKQVAKSVCFVVFIHC